eukprot:TRINITY_DN2591_c0_g1_i1.p1 TRINITY_DN2591_c0_g1~~TRINITY_DN2591_c0_g1_i1.p1  ORF type:complete len:879 (-),score=129.38 TRINITY_DN2591_c0_g1_i1:2494-5130(-)
MLAGKSVSEQTLEDQYAKQEYANPEELNGYFSKQNSRQASRGRRSQEVSQGISLEEMKPQEALPVSHDMAVALQGLRAVTGRGNSSEEEDEIPGYSPNHDSKQQSSSDLEVVEQDDEETEIQQARVQSVSLPKTPHPSLASTLSEVTGSQNLSGPLGSSSIQQMEDSANQLNGTLLAQNQQLQKKSIDQKLEQNGNVHTDALLQHGDVPSVQDVAEQEERNGLQQEEKQGSGEIFDGKAHDSDLTVDEEKDFKDEGNQVQKEATLEASNEPEFHQEIADDGQVDKDVNKNESKPQSAPIIPDLQLSALQLATNGHHDAIETPKKSKWFSNFFTPRKNGATSPRLPFMSKSAAPSPVSASPRAASPISEKGTGDISPQLSIDEMKASLDKLKESADFFGARRAEFRAQLKEDGVAALGHNREPSLLVWSGEAVLTSNPKSPEHQEELEQVQEKIDDVKEQENLKEEEVVILDIVETQPNIEQDSTVHVEHMVDDSDNLGSSDETEDEKQDKGKIIVNEEQPQDIQNSDDNHSLPEAPENIITKTTASAEIQDAKDVEAEPDSPISPINVVDAFEQQNKVPVDVVVEEIQPDDKIINKDCAPSEKEKQEQRNTTILGTQKEVKIKQTFGNGSGKKTFSAPEPINELRQELQPEIPDRVKVKAMAQKFIKESDKDKEGMLRRYHHSITKRSSYVSRESSGNTFNKQSSVASQLSSSTLRSQGSISSQKYRKEIDEESDTASQMSAESTVSSRIMRLRQGWESGAPPVKDQGDEQESQPKNGVNNNSNSKKANFQSLMNNFNGQPAKPPKEEKEKGGVKSAMKMFQDAQPKSKPQQKAPNKLAASLKMFEDAQPKPQPQKKTFGSKVETKRITSTFQKTYSK